MKDTNVVVISGRLTRNPELRYSPSGTAVCNMSMASNNSFKNKAGETVEEPCFVELAAFGRHAEVCSEYIKKGSPVIVTGRLQFDKWEDAAGNSRSKICIRADQVQFLPDGRTHDKPAPAGQAPEMPLEDSDDVPY